ncbi:hypothetical protein LC653_14350 [Nostoc sp. CHAB 5784]|uniref:Uncharacterized protein n=1 Tax=Nostoc favosum CHAB5714 TaxID=2780399 RepID=A0ABS8ICF3_9NOSO|nr:MULTISPECIES: hypothetical protein [Nostoc]MCC5601839.1 hypothetical protein [Nostoc favosum CHAB5714]MCC5665064.1 hypothetical protein [Nostoc mirabile CHAB5784]
MPKYSVSEVLEIIKNLTPSEKLELQQSLPSVLDPISTAAKAAKSHSQNIAGINIGDGNSDIGFNQLQADQGSSVNQNRTEAKVENADVQSALKLLLTLKEDIVASNSLNSIEKKTLEVPIKTIEEELKKPKPDKNLVEQSIEALKKGLTGVAELADPVLKLAPLVAKVWAGI